MAEFDNPPNMEYHKTVYQEYEKVCTEFFKTSIDGKKIDGFLSADDILYKVDFEKSIFGTLFKEKNKVGSIFKVPNIKEYWQLTIKKKLKGN